MENRKEHEDAEYIVQGGYLWIVEESWMWMDGGLLDTAMLSPSCLTKSELD
jgi:hypothetical protein